MNFHIHVFSKDIYRGEMSRQESPNIPMLSLGYGSKQDQGRKYEMQTTWKT
jgi:hypothetical protein